jgi:hypothetical protein
MPAHSVKIKLKKNIRAVRRVLGIAGRFFWSCGMCAPLQEIGSESRRKQDEMRDAVLLVFANKQVPKHQNISHSQRVLPWFVSQFGVPQIATVPLPQDLPQAMTAAEAGSEAKVAGG